VNAIPGLLVLLVGAALLVAPWWSSTLPATDYPLVIVLGSLFASFGAFAALPQRCERLRTLTFALGMGTFGTICAALAFTPSHPGPAGTVAIGGIPGFAIAGPMPWWARAVAGFFAIVCIGAATLGAWGLVRDLVRRRPPER
jgi:hypothetical protein